MFDAMCMHITYTAPTELECIYERVRISRADFYSPDTQAGYMIPSIIFHANYLRTSCWKLHVTNYAADIHSFTNGFMQDCMIGTYLIIVDGNRQGMTKVNLYRPIMGWSLIIISQAGT